MGKKIATYLNSVRGDHPYWEPFVGACGVMQYVEGGKRYGSDACAPMIEMWREAQRGWEPPEDVSEADYERAKAGDVPAHLQAFIGFGCSFGGKWFGGYAKGLQAERRQKRERNYASNASRGVVRKAARVKDVEFSFADFFTVYPPAPECLIYCDPPFMGTTGFGGLPEFDVDRFWDRCRELGGEGHLVLVSEYRAPDDWQTILEVRVKRAKTMGAGSEQSHHYSEGVIAEANTDDSVDVESLYVSNASAQLLSKAAEQEHVWLHFEKE